jgi:N-acetylglucosamine-6-phosphate deacetylase
MSRQSICAWNLDAPQPQAVRVTWQDGVISEFKADVDERPTAWIGPGLCDIQVNGYAGIDFQRDTATGDDLHGVVEKLRLAACTQILATMITDEWSALTNRFRRMRKLRDASPVLRAAIPGWHIEGPFMSGEPGYKGAHNAAFMLDPTPEKIRELREIAGNDPLMLTMAPERNGSIEAIKFATSLGIRISCGHSNASAETFAAAVKAGATMYTHLGNGCPQQLDRHDNILWRVIDQPGLTAGIIPDMIHVAPAPFRILNRLLADRCYLTTDCMSAAGGPPGRYTIGPTELEVGADKIVRQPGKTNFAGSALTPLEGVVRAQTMAPFARAWHLFSTRPRNLMGIPAGFAQGTEATFCVVERSNGAEGSLTVYVRGEEKVRRTIDATFTSMA